MAAYHDYNTKDSVYGAVVMTDYESSLNSLDELQNRVLWVRRIFIVHLTINFSFLLDQTRKYISYP